MLSQQGLAGAPAQWAVEKALLIAHWLRRTAKHRSVRRMHRSQGCYARGTPSKTPSRHSCDGSGPTKKQLPPFDKSLWCSIEKCGRLLLEDDGRRRHCPCGAYDTCNKRLPTFLQDFFSLSEPPVSLIERCNIGSVCKHDNVSSEKRHKNCLFSILANPRHLRRPSTSSTRARHAPDLGSATESPARESPSCPPSPLFSTAEGGPPSRGSRWKEHHSLCHQQQQQRPYRCSFSPRWRPDDFARGCWKPPPPPRHFRSRGLRIEAFFASYAGETRLGFVSRGSCLSRLSCPCAWPEPLTFFSTSRPARLVQSRSNALSYSRNTELHKHIEGVRSLGMHQLGAEAQNNTLRSMYHKHTNNAFLAYVYMVSLEVSSHVIICFAGNGSLRADRRATWQRWSSLMV